MIREEDIQDITEVTLDQEYLDISGMDQVDHKNNKAGVFTTPDGKTHEMILNDPHAIALADSVKVDSIFQFDTQLAQCVKHDSLINTKEGLKKISDLDPKLDKICYLAKGGEVKVTEKYVVKKSGVKPIKKITLENGKVLYVTKEHKILTDEGYQYAQNLKVGDLIVQVKEDNS